MKLTTITVRYGRTQSLPAYSNIRPEVSLTAELEPDDDPSAAHAALLAQAKAIVYEEIDSALEADDMAAKFSTEPRYRLLVTAEWVWILGREPGARDRKVEAPEQMIIIVPQGVEVPRPPRDRESWWSQFGAKLRLAHAWRRVGVYADERPGTYRIVNCADGNLGRVPAWVFDDPANLEAHTQPAGPALVFGEPDDSSYEAYRAQQEEDSQ